MEPKIKDEITQELEYSENVKKKLEMISKHERVIKKKSFINRIFDKIKLFFIKF